MIVFILAVVVAQEDTGPGQTMGAGLGGPNDIVHVRAPTRDSTVKQKGKVNGYHLLAPLSVAPLKQ